MGDSKQAKFAGFYRRDVVYHKIGNHSLYASVWTPVEVAQPNAGRERPVLVFWHGGGWITGDRLYEPWWPRWLIEYALAQSAIVIAPDYRLLPEATGADVLDDMDAFWNWFLHDLQVIAENEAWPLQPDVKKVLCAGQSAGGSIAVHSALEHPEVGVRVVVSQCAPLYHDVPLLRMCRPRMILGSWPPPPRQAEAKIRAYIRQTQGTTRSASDPVTSWDLVLSILQQGWLPRLVRRRPHARLDTVRLLRDAEGMPPLWLVHGEQDSVVPPECTVEFAKIVGETMPAAPLLVSLKPGDHAFDTDQTLEESWLREGCAFVSTHWLR